MVQFPWFPTSRLCIHLKAAQRLSLSGFPHSGIHGSTLACSSPWLIAAGYALLRSLAPRHPPYALHNLLLNFDTQPIAYRASYLTPYHFQRPNIEQRSREKLSIVQLDRKSSHAFPRDSSFLRKEVIQPQVLLRLPCYDFTPVTDPTFDSCLLAVSSPASGVIGSHGVTGGVYKARERIQRGMLIRVY